jgi:hypothetical protein
MDSPLCENAEGDPASREAVWDTHFKTWQPVPTEILLPLVREIRKRKSLSAEPPISSIAAFFGDTVY